jgi:hypothetical protein
MYGELPYHITLRRTNLSELVHLARSVRRTTTQGGLAQMMAPVLRPRPLPRLPLPSSATGQDVRSRMTDRAAAVAYRTTRSASGVRLATSG